jgi:hypothetical protein
MNAKLILIGLFLAGLLIGGAAVWLGKDMITNFNVSADAKTAAQHVQVYVNDNNYEFTMNPDDPKVCHIVFWQSGGVALALSETWMNVTWQLDLSAEDKPYTDGRGDFLDVILKICKWPSGDTSYTILCAGDYVKKIYYDSVLKLDSSVSRYGTWTVPAA